MVFAGAFGVTDRVCLAAPGNPAAEAGVHVVMGGVGYRVSEADSGQAALEVLLAGDIFDLLFTDVVMPDGMTGPQLAATARHLRPGMKVLFTTGYSRSDLANDLVGTATGAVIRKPYRRQELAVAVRATLEAQH